MAKTICVCTTSGEGALVMSYAETARLLNRSKMTVRSYVHKGILNEFRLPGCARALGVDVRSIRDLLNAAKKGGR